MEIMTVIHPFDEYEGEHLVNRAKGDTVKVSAERAEHLRENGLARKKPEGRGSSDDDRTESGTEQDPGTAPKA